MHGVTVAVDCLARYNQRVRKDASALNMFGVLLEREGLYRSALKALEMAMHNLSESERPQLEASVRLNMGRTLIKLRRYAEAVAQFEAVAPETFESLCGRALALFKNGDYQGSYGAYQKALSAAWETEDKSHILAAMASIAYK